MYGGYTYGGTNYGGIGSAGNFFSKILDDTITVTTTTFTRVINKVLVDTPIMVSNLFKAMTRAFSDAYSITSSFLNMAIKNLSDSLSLSELFSKLVTFKRSFTDNLTLTSTITAAGIYRRTLSDTITATVNSFTKTANKVFFDTYNILDTIRRYLNGLIINPWTKVVKTIASFTKIVKPTATYTKTVKPDDNIWTKTDKPY